MAAFIVPHNCIILYSPKNITQHIYTHIVTQLKNDPLNVTWNRKVVTVLRWQLAHWNSWLLTLTVPNATTQRPVY